MQMKPVIVLVSPQMGENIGAAARIMGNFALTELRIVSPRDGWPNPAAEAMAAHAHQVIEEAALYNSIAEAVADCHLIYATSGHLQDSTKTTHSPRQWSESLPKDQKTAILFGKESSGLSKEELSHAHGIISIPVSAHCPSLNLAQAVAVVAYEYFQHRQQTSATHQEDTPVFSENTMERPARKGEVEGFFQQLETALDAVDFWRVAHKKNTMWRNIRNMFTRRTLTLQEVQTLRGMIKSLQRKP